MENKNLKESTALKTLNIVAIGIEIFAIVDLFASALKTDVTVVSSFYFLSLIWSVIYQMYPSVRTNVIYRFLAHTFWTLALMFLIINIYAYIFANEWGSILVMMMLVYFSAPAGLVAITLLLLLNYDTPTDSERLHYQQMIYISAPEAQLFANPIHKML